MKRLSRQRLEIARNITNAIIDLMASGDITKEEAKEQFRKLPALKGFPVPASLREESDDLYGEMNEGIGLAIMAGSLAAAALTGDESSPQEVIDDTISDEEKQRIAAELVKKMQKDPSFQDLAKKWEEADN